MVALRRYGDLLVAHAAGGQISGTGGMPLSIEISDGSSKEEQWSHISGTYIEIFGLSFKSQTTLSTFFTRPSGRLQSIDLSIEAKLVMSSYRARTRMLGIVSLASPKNSSPHLFLRFA